MSRYTTVRAVEKALVPTKVAIVHEIKKSSLPVHVSKKHISLITRCLAPPEKNTVSNTKQVDVVLGVNITCPERTEDEHLAYSRLDMTDTVTRSNL